MNVLLITGTIDIEGENIPYTKLTDKKVRLGQYIEAIEYAIKEYHTVSHIVFCDNSNYQYDYSSMMEFAKSKGKVLEIYQFLGNRDKVREKGKGYGEGEILAYLLEHCEILKQCKFFYKLTGRVIVKNFDKVHCKSSDDNHFICYHSRNNKMKDVVGTVFYKINKDLYVNLLKDEYQEVNDKEGHYLESVYYQKLKKVNIKSFTVFPIISGISGSTGMRYDIDKKRLFLERLMNILGMRNMKSYQWLFNFLKQIK